MLLSKTALVKWNSRNYNHYINLGYKYTKMGDEFEVSINHLTPGSYAKVTYECDFCHQTLTTQWQTYMYKRNKCVTANDCCSNCLQIKAKQNMEAKYGDNNFRHIESINRKILETNLKKYGCENPFGNKEIQNKIKQHYLDKYGVESCRQIPEVEEKRKQTCLEKYGVTNYGAIWAREHCREKSPTWKGENVIHERIDRGLPEYRSWRKQVFGRDKYTCQCCGAKNGNGKFIRLEAHHIFNWGKYPDKRFDVNNGITLCQQCHIDFHSAYGKTDNNNIQLQRFLNVDKKIC